MRDPEEDSDEHEQGSGGGRGGAGHHAGIGHAPGSLGHAPGSLGHVPGSLGHAPGSLAPGGGGYKGVEEGVRHSFGGLGGEEEDAGGGGPGGDGEQGGDPDALGEVDFLSAKDELQWRDSHGVAVGLSSRGLRRVGWKRKRSWSGLDWVWVLSGRPHVWEAVPWFWVVRMGMRMAAVKDAHVGSSVGGKGSQHPLSSLGAAVSLEDDLQLPEEDEDEEEAIRVHPGKAGAVADGHRGHGGDVFRGGGQVGGEESEEEEGVGGGDRDRDSGGDGDAGGDADDASEKEDPVGRAHVEDDVEEGGEWAGLEERVKDVQDVDDDDRSGVVGQERAGGDVDVVGGGVDADGGGSQKGRVASWGWWKGGRMRKVKRRSVTVKEG
eukprot:jgi/Mesvir1/4415/Mv11913-RA.1